MHRLEEYAGRVYGDSLRTQGAKAKGEKVK
jgi:hypothetical protein